MVTCVPNMDSELSMILQADLMPRFLQCLRKGIGLGILEGLRLWWNPKKIVLS